MESFRRDIKGEITLQDFAVPEPFNNFLKVYPRNLRLFGDGLGFGDNRSLKTEPFKEREVSKHSLTLSDLAGRIVVPGNVTPPNINGARRFEHVIWVVRQIPTNDVRDSRRAATELCPSIGLVEIRNTRIPLNDSANLLVIKRWSLMVGNILPRLHLVIIRDSN